MAPEGVTGCNSKLAQYSNTPILHHSGVTSLLRTGVREVFVPKGLDEGSQAIYCLGCVPKKVTVPEGRCERRYPMYWLPQVEERPVDPIIPSLRDGSPFWMFQAINCLVTIAQSLRDNKPPLPVRIFESTSPG